MSAAMGKALKSIFTFGLDTGCGYGPQTKLVPLFPEVNPISSVCRSLFPLVFSPPNFSTPFSFTAFPFYTLLLVGLSS